MEIDEELTVAFIAVLMGLFFVLVLLRSTRARQTLPALVLHQCRVSQTPDDGRFVVLEGRPEGAWHSLLAFFRVGPSFRFEVNRAAIQFGSDRFGGEGLISIPLLSVASVSIGATRAPSYLLSAALTAMLGGFGYSFLLASSKRRGELFEEGLQVFVVVAILLCAVLVVGFFSSRRMTVEVETSGGRSVGLRFKPGAAGASGFGSKEGALAVYIINELVAMVANGRCRA